MQRIFTLTLFIVFSISVFSQTRYKDELFSVFKHDDIQYGSNYDSKNHLTNLLMDIYEPQGDSAKKRPVIFFIHGGSFVGGDRADQSIDKTAEFFAKKGYVTVNIEYRLEQTTFIDPIVNFADTYNWHRAIVRATQDLKAAIRFLKKDVATNNNSYAVDTTSIFIYGSSAGAITALHTVYLDDTLEMNSIFKIAYRELGGLDGNSGNAGYSSTSGIKAVVSCSGAIFDLNCMNNNKNIEFLGFHNNPDFTVPYDVGCFVTVACWLGNYYGGNKVFPKAKSLGSYAEFYPINQVGHPADQVSDTASHRMILQKTTDFLYRIVNPSITTSVKNNIAKNADIFPNPSSGDITINIPVSMQQKVFQLQIFNVEGTEVYSAQFKNKDNVQLQLTLPNGIYVLSINNAEENYLSKITIVK